MIIEYATAGGKHRKALETMWKDCFGVDEDYLKLYFAQRYRPEETLVCTVDGQAAAMLTMLPCEYRQGNRVYSCLYIFAVATHPDYQGRGLCTGLLEEAHQRMVSDGVELSVLAPAEEYLFSFYRKRGYEDWFFHREKDFLSVENPSVFPQLERLNSAEYAELRENLMSKHNIEGYIFWDTAALAFGEAESQLYSGGLYLLKNGAEGFAICHLYQENKQVLVKELLCDEQIFAKKAAELLCSAFPGRSLKLRLPHWVELGAIGIGEETVNGMAKWFVKPPSNLKAYLSFVLD